MVKRIDSTKTPATSGSQPVEPGKAVQTTGVGKVSQVTSTTAQAPARAVRRPTRPMTAEERDHLMRLVQEEADKLFGEEGLPQDKRRKVERAVQMAIDAGITVEESDAGKPAKK